MCWASCTNIYVMMVYLVAFVVCFLGFLYTHLCNDGIELRVLLFVVVVFVRLPVHK